VLIQIVACGVCHTDLAAIDGEWPVKARLPLIPGHEGVGYVAAVGAGVTSPKEGDRVGLPWLYWACGKCEYCLSGRENLCASQKNTGYSTDGCYAEYVVAPADFVAHLPATLRFVEAAPILCAGLTTYKGVKETDTKPGDWVVISGIGGLGHLGVQYARAMGRRVAAVDVSDDKLLLARHLGAELTVNAAAEDPVDRICCETGGAHGVLVTAASTKAFHQGVEMLRSGGTCILIGIASGDLPIPIYETVIKRLTIRGSPVGTRKDLHEALAIAGDGRVSASIELGSLEGVNAALDRLRHGEVRGRLVLQVRPSSPGSP
jgi:propanol-preferring alcohol dehydrogenase